MASASGRWALPLKTTTGMSGTGSPGAGPGCRGQGNPAAQGETGPIGPARPVRTARGPGCRRSARYLGPDGPLLMRTRSGETGSTGEGPVPAYPHPRPLPHERTIMRLTSILTTGACRGRLGRAPRAGPRSPSTSPALPATTTCAARTPTTRSTARRATTSSRASADRTRCSGQGGDDQLRGGSDSARDLLDGGRRSRPADRRTGRGLLPRRPGRRRRPRVGPATTSSRRSRVSDQIFMGPGNDSLSFLDDDGQRAVIDCGQGHDVVELPGRRSTRRTSSARTATQRQRQHERLRRARLAAEPLRAARARR